jgi:putative salt-induced outer membrane protein
LGQLTSTAALLTGLTCTPLSIANEIDTDPTETHSPFSSEIEFGYQSHTGNTDSQAINSRFDSQYVSGRHRHSGEFKLHKLDKDGVEDKFQLTLEGQSDYKLAPETYLYGGIKAIDSRHSAYFKDYTFSTGVGYQAANSDNLLIELELGPGYRYQEPNLDEIDDDDIIFPNIVKEPIIRGQINADWHVIDNLSLSAKYTVTSGSSNTKIDSEISATNNITEGIALKIAHEKQHHNRVPEGLNNSESSLSINLLFAF